MRFTFGIIFTFLAFLGISQTQAEMNQMAYAEYDKSDQLLNEVYQTILNQYKADTLFIKNLRTSQRIWIKFRDAELTMKFPDYPDHPYGTIHPTCRAYYLKELTDQRINTLKIWLHGIEEGDVCNGSTQIEQQIDYSNYNLAGVHPDSSVYLVADMKKDHRIFGYRDADVTSEKLILFSIFTNEVQHNPYNCNYGAYYDMQGLRNYQLKFTAIEGDFLKIEITQNGEKLDDLYMVKYNFEFVH